jgi:hypothetical protein
LQEERDECLNLEYLCGLLHEDVVILEAQAHQLSALQGRVRARHRNYLHKNSNCRHTYWFCAKSSGSGTGPTFQLIPEPVTHKTMHFNSIADPHLDADPDPDPVCHFDEDPDPTFHFHADKDPSFQIKARNIEKVLE